MTHSTDPSAGKSRRWGIRSDSPGAGSLSQKFALVAGLAYLVGGVIGFLFTGLNDTTEFTGESLFGIFHLTPMHNVVHVGVGALWLIAALTLTNVACEGVNFAIAGVYVLAAILGYLGYLEMLGIHAGLDADNFLHAVTGVVTLLFAGLIPSRDPVGAGVR
ncbi:MAG TPA: DUF4383 domain-containing protein [Gemmatimonadales bacterium]|nr:DUF4383 domain-containing protein [Gemmatimonadales bacterium]